MPPEMGGLAAHGMVLELLTRGAPSILATLWDVTDRDMDWITLKLLQLLAKAPAYLIPDLVRTAKNEAKLRMLNGSALVCYGLPVSLEDIHLARLGNRASMSKTPARTSMRRVETRRTPLSFPSIDAMRLRWLFGLLHDLKGPCGPLPSVPDKQNGGDRAR